MIPVRTLPDPVNRTSDTQRRAGTIRVLLAVGPRLACDAYVARMRLEEDLVVLGAPGGLAPVLETAASMNPDVIVFDSQASDDDAADEVVAKLDAFRHGGVVVLVGESDRGLVPRFIRVGAAATVLKSAPADELLGAVRHVGHGGGYVSPQLLPRLFEEIRGRSDKGDRRLARLTPREIEVLQLMVNGLGTKEMAARLFLSVDTIRTHLRTIMEKLDVHSSTAAVSVAHSAGLRPST